MERRKFLKLGCATTAVICAPTAALAQAAGPIRLVIEPVDNEMIDGYICYMLAYFQDGNKPRPVLRVTEGDVVRIEVTNNDTRPHSFKVSGIAGSDINSIPPGGTGIANFTAPVGGTYLYYDHLNDPVNRVLGLHGAFIVKPRLGTTLNNAPTPYSRARQTPAIRAVFDAMGQGKFPGNKWDPNDPERDKVWVMCQTDPELNRRVLAGETVDPPNVKYAFLPRYFHINWLSGFDTAEHTDTEPEALEAARAIMPHGRQGQPTLIRTLNAGLALHSLHIHGNHVFALTDVETTVSQGIIFEDNVFERDAWRLQPLDRRDVLLPFDRPRDIPTAAWPPRDEPFPLRYVMHCHCEMSQTAAGGNYPMGLVTHWEMTAPLS